MIDVLVSEAMSEPVPLVEPTCPIPEAASKLRQPEVPALVVGDSPADLSGVVTESDIVALVAEEGFTETVETCMSSPVVTTRPTTPVGLAADRMRDASVTLLPVVDDGEYVGFLTRGSLAPYLSRQRLEVTWEGDPLTLA
jgi:CBS domain-containing protein